MLRFEFDRYINGTLMAEGVVVERQFTLPDAMKVAARIASKGPNGETPVLVLRAGSATVSAEAVRAEIAWHENAKSLALKMAEGNPNPHTAATLRYIADAHNEAHARLSALLPPEETKP